MYRNLQFFFVPVSYLPTYPFKVHPRHPSFSLSLFLGGKQRRARFRSWMDKRPTFSRKKPANNNPSIAQSRIENFHCISKLKMVWQSSFWLLRKLPNQPLKPPTEHGFWCGATRHSCKKKVKTIFSRCWLEEKETKRERNWIKVPPPFPQLQTQPPLQVGYTRIAF